MLEYQMCIRYVIVLAILHILIGIGLTNKLQNRRTELWLIILVFSENSINFSSEGDSFGWGDTPGWGGKPRFSRPLYQSLYI